ncbi:uncharacterized protein LOC134530939 isoform X2 [Bacillus rossius redtenbacheri]|uniref:uncharacterized protein LOC134530939 isoform X2 n=2 Tax=Bacillus rossius redtenbacheri TaxID=93214 RepID=UPI002FDCA057
MPCGPSLASKLLCLQAVGCESGEARMSGGRRPRIEVVRVSSTERAKLRPLLEGGVQLQARFKHHRSNNYASCGSLDDAHCRHLRYESQGSEGRQPPLATKSCDDIFAGQLSGSPFTWQDATRSAEHLCPDATHARCATLPAGEATRSEGHIHQITRMQATTTAPLTTRLRLITFLKKLSPRPRRLTSKVLRAQNVFPWVVMELAGRRSEQQAVGLAGRCHSEDSTASDRSFAVAVRINRQRKQQALASALQAKEPSQQAPAAPRIVIASPGPSPAPRPGPQQCSVMSG